jgi:hypothetical protein
MTQKMENSTQSAINPNQAASNSTTFNPSSNIESSIKDELNTNNNSNNKSQAAALNQSLRSQTPANASASKLMNIGGGSGGGGVANFQQQNPMMPQAGSYMNMNTFMDPYMFNPQSFTPQPQLTQTIIPNSKTIPSNLNSISASQTQKKQQQQQQQSNNYTNDQSYDDGLSANAVSIPNDANVSNGSNGRSLRLQHEPLHVPVSVWAIRHAHATIIRSITRRSTVNAELCLLRRHSERPKA